MKKNLKRALSMFLAFAMCICLNTSAFATTTAALALQTAGASNYLGNVVFSLSGTTNTVLPSSGSRTVRLSGAPTMIGYTFILAKPYREGKVNVTFTNTRFPQYEKTVTLIADGTYHTADVSGANLGYLDTTITVSYTRLTVPLLSISISFVN